MRSRAFLIAASLALCDTAALAQTASLGGYGAMAAGDGPSSVGAGAPVAPFGGRFGVTTSSGMSASGTTSFRPRPSAAMSDARAPFSLGPMGGMSGSGAGPRPFALTGSRSFLPAGMARPMANTRGMGVMPPRFASPFRQPPSLMGTAGSGPSM